MEDMPICHLPVFIVAIQLAFRQTYDLQRIHRGGQLAASSDLCDHEIDLANISKGLCQVSIYRNLYRFVWIYYKYEARYMAGLWLAKLMTVFGASCPTMRAFHPVRGGHKA